jgi:hypothetical protein
LTVSQNCVFDDFDFLIILISIILHLRRIREYDAHIRHESGVNLAHMSCKCYVQNLHTMCVIACHHANVAHTCRVRSVQQDSYWHLALLQSTLKTHDYVDTYIAILIKGCQVHILGIKIQTLKSNFISNGMDIRFYQF